MSDAFPNIPAPPHLGGCLCGAARYKLEARPRAINACHCMDCKKLSGATHILMLIADTDSFIHERGEVERYRKRADSGREVDIVRCARCGVRMWHEPVASPEFRFVAAGTLDHPQWASPTSHIWLQSISPGVLIAPETLLVDAQPENRQMLIAAFEGIHGVQR